MNIFSFLKPHKDPIELPRPTVVLAYGVAGEKAAQRRYLFQWRWRGLSRVCPLPRDIEAARAWLRRLDGLGLLPVVIFDGEDAQDLFDIGGVDLPDFVPVNAVDEPGKAVRQLMAADEGIIQAWRAFCQSVPLQPAKPWSDPEFAMAYGAAFGDWLSHRDPSDGLTPNHPLNLGDFVYSDYRAGRAILSHCGLPIAYLELQAAETGAWNAQPGGALAGLKADTLRFRWKNKAYALDDVPQEAWNRRLPVDLGIFIRRRPERIDLWQGTLKWFTERFSDLPALAARMEPVLLSAESPAAVQAALSQTPVVVIRFEAGEPAARVAIKFMKPPAQPSEVRVFLDDRPLNDPGIGWSAWSPHDLSVQFLSIPRQILGDDANLGGSGSLAVAFSREENCLHLRLYSAADRIGPPNTSDQPADETPAKDHIDPETLLDHPINPASASPEPASNVTYLKTKPKALWASATILPKAAADSTSHNLAREFNVKFKSEGGDYEVGEGTLSREMIPTDSEWQILRFKCSPEWQALLEGRKVEVEIAGEPLYELGAINFLGIAETYIRSTLDLNKAITVHISEREE